MAAPWQPHGWDVLTMAKLAYVMTGFEWRFLTFRPDCVFVQGTVQQYTVGAFSIHVSPDEVLFVIMGFGVKAFRLCRINAGPLIWDGGFPCDHKSCSVTFDLSERSTPLRRWYRSSWLFLLEWAGCFTRLPTGTVKYGRYLAGFFIYVSSGWQGFGLEEEEMEMEAAREE